MKHHSNQADEKETTRIEAFSDGVFAIAITLLVLELIGTLHSHRSLHLRSFFIGNWQSFLAFLIGFITILVCWINHHTVFEYIRKTDTNFMWINGFLLFLVTFTPFPTAVLAEYLQTESTMALSIYGFNYVMISIASYCICSYAYNHQLIYEAQKEIFYFYKVLYRYSIIYTIIAFSFSFISIIVPIILYIILFIVFAAPGKFAYWLSNNSKKRRMASKANH
ncbi:MAG TPA: TMEM175 family protein [Puia sp.]|nr:TMEM175 family protein [Puia sp.]